MAKRTSDNTMAKRTRTIQWQKEQGQYNGKNNVSVLIVAILYLIE
jgi:hypothetical protein